MKKLVIFASAFLALLPVYVFAQQQNFPPSTTNFQTLTTDPSTCNKGQVWFNTTSNLPKTCLTANTVSTFDTSASSSFPLLAPDGSALVPSYSFTGDTGTGLFRVNGNDDLEVAVTSTAWWRFESTGGLTALVSGEPISLTGGTVTALKFAASGTANGVTLAESTGPAGASSSDNLFGDSTTHTISYNANNNGTSSFSGSWNCTNVTPVTVSTNTAADQNMMACTIPAGTLNRALRSLRVYTAGVYSTPAASTSQMTIKVKLCTVSGCGSGTVITPISIQSTALGTVQITNDNFSLHSDITTQTAGASSAYESHGEFLIDLSTLTTAADSPFGDTNTATVGTIDNTGQLFLQTTFAFSGASASNTATQRQLIVDTVN